MTRGYSYQNIATNATSTVKSGAGILKRITINAIGSSDALATIYDNTAGSGTKIATISLGVFPVTIEFDARFGAGLTIVTSGSVAGNITAIYE
jgi:hypothetical protein